MILDIYIANIIYSAVNSLLDKVAKDTDGKPPARGKPNFFKYVTQSSSNTRSTRIPTISTPGTFQKNLAH